MSKDETLQLDEEDSKIMLEQLKKSGKPIEIKYLKDAKKIGNALHFDLNLEIDKK